MEQDNNIDMKQALNQNIASEKCDQEIDESVVLEIEDLYVTYKSERSTAQALNGISLVVHKGESIGIVGESGAGKTTTALSILNLLPEDAARVTHGDVRFHGKSVFKMKRRELYKLRGGRIAMIFQNPLTALNPVFSVGEQIALVSRLHKGMSKAKAREDAKAMLELVGIPGARIADYPNQLSGGMRQRVGIAAALAANPEVLIADEPTTALDVTIQAQILEIMKKMQQQYSTATIMITHNLGIVAELCQKVAVMYAGRIIETGTVEEVFASPQHPYTRGLIDALPSWEGDVKERLTAIPGLVADAQNLPTGCAFHLRCEHCKEICKNQQPDMVRITDNHSVACFHYTEDNV